MRDTSINNFGAFRGYEVKIWQPQDDLLNRGLKPNRHQVLNSDNKALFSWSYSSFISQLSIHIPFERGDTQLL